MTAETRWPCENTWAGAAALYAWCATLLLTALLSVGTLAIVAPPAVVATAPLLVATRHRSVACLVAAVVLAAWAVAGIALLGLYFLPAAVLLVVQYSRSRSRSLRAAGEGTRS